MKESAAHKPPRESAYQILIVKLIFMFPFIFQILTVLSLLLDAEKLLQSSLHAHRYAPQFI